MRGGWQIFLFACVLLAGAAAAQTTQPLAQPPAASAAVTEPAPQQQLIRRDAATGAAAGDPAGPSASRVALSLGAVLALIVGLFLVGRRFLPRGALAKHGGGGGGAVQVLARTAISPKQRIVLLQVGRRILVVGDGGAGLATLCEITDADEAAALIGQLQSEKGGGSFGAALNGAMERFRAAEASRREPVREPSSSSREPHPDLDSMRQELEGLARRVRGMAR